MIIPLVKALTRMFILVKSEFYISFTIHFEGNVRCVGIYFGKLALFLLI